MPLDTDNPELRVAVFGKQVEDFLDSDIGRYLTECAQLEIDDAVKLLKRVDPFSSEEVRNAQFNVWRAETIMGWLADAIQRGRQATEVLKGED